MREAEWRSPAASVQENDTRINANSEKPPVNIVNIAQNEVIQTSSIRHHPRTSRDLPDGTATLQDNGSVHTDVRSPTGDGQSIRSQAGSVQQRNSGFGTNPRTSLETNDSVRTHPQPSPERTTTLDFANHGSRSPPHPASIEEPEPPTPEQVRLIPGRPGRWVVEHHRQGLIIELTPSRESLLARAKAKARTSWRNIHTTHHKLDDRHTDDNLAGHDDEERRFEINFAELQRMRLRKLQCILVEDAVHMHQTGTESEAWEEHLSQYVNALQEYDYMSECAKRARDPFLASGELWVDKYIIDSSLQQHMGYLEKDYLKEPSILAWEGPDKPTMPITGTRGAVRQLSAFRKFQQRLLIATIGGLLLVGPMWLIVSYQARYTAVVTTTVMVFIFGLIMSVSLEDSKDVLASTAAYAAVLVVFVGVNTNPSP